MMLHLSATNDNTARFRGELIVDAVSDDSPSLNGDRALEPMGMSIRAVRILSKLGDPIFTIFTHAYTHTSLICR